MNFYNFLDKADTFVESDTCGKWKFYFIAFLFCMIIIDAIFILLDKGQNEINNEVKKIEKETEDEK